MLAPNVGGHSRDAGKMILGVSERIESRLSTRIVAVWRLERIDVLMCPSETVRFQQLRRANAMRAKQMDHHGSNPEIEYVISG